MDNARTATLAMQVNLWMVQASVVLAVVVAAGLHPATQDEMYATS